MEVREAHPAFRVFRLSGSNVVYAYQEKFSGTRIICKFYGPRFADLDKAAWMARQEYEGLETLRRYNLIGSPHHVIRPLGFSRDINGVLAVEYYPGEEFSQAIARATQHRDDRHLEGSTGHPERQDEKRSQETCEERGLPGREGADGAGRGGHDATVRRRPPWSRGG